MLAEKNAQIGALGSGALLFVPRHSPDQGWATDNLFNLGFHQEALICLICKRIQLFLTRKIQGRCASVPKLYVPHVVWP